MYIHDRLAVDVMPCLGRMDGYTCPPPPLTNPSCLIDRSMRQAATRTATTVYGGFFVNTGPLELEKGGSSSTHGAAARGGGEGGNSEESGEESEGGGVGEGWVREWCLWECARAWVKVCVHACVHVYMYALRFTHTFIYLYL